jgi:hypothetical protein
MNAAFKVVLCFVVITTLSESYSQTVSPTKNEDVTNFKKRYSAFVDQFQELSLSEIGTDSQAEVYRMMIIPTWGNAISITAQKRDGIYALSARRLEGQAGFQVGNLVERRDFCLTQADSSVLDNLIQKVNLLGMPSSDGVMGTDGDQWVVEGVSHGKYHFVERWCATECNPKKRGLLNFDALCKFLVDKSKLSARPTNKGRALI